MELTSKDSPARVLESKSTTHANEEVDRYGGSTSVLYANLTSKQKIIGVHGVFDDYDFLVTFGFIISEVVDVNDEELQEE